MPLLGLHNEDGRAAECLASDHDRTLETEENEESGFFACIGSFLRIVLCISTCFPRTTNTRVPTPRKDIVPPDSSKQPSISCPPRERVVVDGTQTYKCSNCDFVSQYSWRMDWHEVRYAKTSRGLADLKAASPTSYVTGESWIPSQASSHSFGTTLAEHELDSSSSGKSSESYENGSQSTSIGCFQTDIIVETTTTTITTQPYFNPTHQPPPTPPSSRTTSMHRQDSL